MDYQQALDYLYSFVDSERRLPQQPVEFNLPRTHALLSVLGDPQRHYPSVVIAGTKGKGSTAAMAEAMLRAGERRVGLFSSPHLHSYRERIQVNRELITRDAFCAAVERMQPAVAALDPAFGSVSTFELGTGLALQYFADRQVDIAVLEIGLGGRFDSVNAVTPLVSAITSLSLDHTQVLGSTLPEIAYQKAGIIKQAVPVVSASQPSEALAVLQQVADEQAAPLYVAHEHALVHLATGAQRPYPVPVTPDRLSLAGAVQLENARVALGILMLLADNGLFTPAAALAQGLATTWWPGRLEQAGTRPQIVLDGAHNGESAARLVYELRNSFRFRRLVLLLGVSRDKDLAAILRPLLSVSDEVVLAASQHPRALTDLEQLAALCRPLTLSPLHLGGQLPAALDLAYRLAAPDDLICVTGSLFVVAEARQALGLLCAEPD